MGTGDGKIGDVYRFDDAAEAPVCKNKKAWTDKLINNMKCITPYHQGWLADDRVSPGFIPWIVIVGGITALLLIVLILAIICVAFRNGNLKGLRNRVKEKKSENENLLGDIQSLEESIVVANEKHDRLLKIVDDKLERSESKKKPFAEFSAEC